MKEPSVALLPSLKQKENCESEELKQVLPTLECRPSLGHETSALSVQSDSTLEFHDALCTADVMRPASRLDEDDEVIGRHPESNTATVAEEPIAYREMENDEKVLKFERQQESKEELSKDATEKWMEESTGGREVQPVVPGTSLEESNQYDSMHHDILVPRESIRTSGVSEKMSREEIKDTDVDVTVEEPISTSQKDSESRDSAEHSVLYNEPITELPAFRSEAFNKEPKDKLEPMETSGENS